MKKKITKEVLEDWLNKAYWYYLSEYTVPMVASESPYGFEFGLKWIESKEESISSAGWSTLSFLSGIISDDELDKKTFEKLIEKAEKEISNAKPRVRYSMNRFIISTATNIPALTQRAVKAAEKIGKVTVEMAGTSCKVPVAKEQIQKYLKEGRGTKKRKSYRY